MWHSHVAQPGWAEPYSFGQYWANQTHIATSSSHYVSNLYSYVLDSSDPPSYSYIKPTVLGTPPWCRFGCNSLEDGHHIFVRCPHFSDLRTSVTTLLLDEISPLLESNSSGISLACRQRIIHQTKNMFDYTTVWPTSKLLFYLGLTPKATLSHLGNTCLYAKIRNTWHLSEIRLASRIWASFRKQTHMA